MRISDFQLHSRKELDETLAKCCEEVIKGQQTNPDKHGMVGACVMSPDGNKTYSTSLKEDDKWKHAERCALESYTKKYGKLPAGSMVVTTLSPCSDSMADRMGESCTDLLNEVGIQQVYCGYVDPTQEEGLEFSKKQFNTMQSSNKKLVKICKKMSDTFLDKLDEGAIYEDSEGADDSILKVNEKEVIKEFIGWTRQVLGIKSNPKIVLSKNTHEAQQGHHTGRHTEPDNQIWVYVKNRNLVDILRTLFHEFVHVRQGERNMIKPDSSYPGSPIERQADELAGKYIKIFGAKHPEIFQ